MKKISSVFILLPILISLSSHAQRILTPSELSLEKLWECATGFSVPESVIYDSERELIYVANIHGNSAEQDGLGYISKLSPDGKLLDSAWVDGLNAPKGMAIHGSMLYVADINRLVCIDLNRAAIIQTYSMPGARFLNDVAISSKGKIFVSDTRQAQIYTLQDEKLELWYEDTVSLMRVNGLYAGHDSLFAGTANGIMVFPHADDPIDHTLIIGGTGFIDGLERYANLWIYSDWAGHITSDDGHKKKILLDTAEEKINAADIDVYEAGSMLLVPTFFNNTVAAYRIVNNNPKISR